MMTCPYLETPLSALPFSSHEQAALTKAGLTTVTQLAHASVEWEAQPSGARTYTLGPHAQKYNIEHTLDVWLRSNIPASDRRLNDVERTELSVRITNALQRAGIRSVHLLATFSEAELCVLGPIGPGSIAQIKAFLATQDLTLAQGAS